MKSGCNSGANAGDFFFLLTHYHSVHEVCLHLHQRIVDCHAAVNCHSIDLNPRIFFHCLNNFSGSQTRRFKQGSHKMTSGCIERHPNQQATSVVPPIRTENTLERWYKVNIATVGYCKSLCFNIFNVCNQSNLLSPLNSSPCNLYCAFECVVSLVAKSVAQSCEESKLRLNRGLSSV